MTREKVLLDPSLLVTEKELAVTKNRLDRHQEFQFYIPSALFDAIEASYRFEDTAVYRFYETGGEPARPERIHEILELFPNLRIHDYPRREEDSIFSSELFYYARYDGSEFLANLLAQEYAFLTGESIIVAEIKKQIEKFKRVGSVVIDIGETAFERIIKRTLDIDEEHHDQGDEILNTANTLRAFGKFVAVGGSVILPAISGSFIGTITGAGCAIIALVDPDSGEVYAANI